jgi:hypothetical protein
MTRKRMKNGDILLLDILVRRYGAKVVKDAAESSPVRSRRGRPKRGEELDFKRWSQVELNRRLDPKGSTIRAAKLIAKKVGSSWESLRKAHSTIERRRRSDPELDKAAANYIALADKALEEFLGEFFAHVKRQSD